jgi:hypothetical protein
LKRDAERLRKEIWSQNASAQTDRVNFGDYPDEGVVHGLLPITGTFSNPHWLLGVAVPGR